MEKFANKKLSSSEIFDILYSFKIEKDCRQVYEIIFKELGINENEIAHMDASIFPYKNDNFFTEFRSIDSTYSYLLKTIDILSSQLKFILIDGKNNKQIFDRLLTDFVILDNSEHQVNSKKKKFELIICKHKKHNLFLIYYAHFLGRSGCPEYKKMDELGKYINKYLNNNYHSKSIDISYKNDFLKTQEVLNFSKIKTNLLQTQKNELKSHYNNNDKLFALIDNNIKEYDFSIKSTHTINRFYANFQKDQVSVAIDMCENFIRINLYMSDFAITFDKLLPYKDEINNEFEVNLLWNRKTQKGEKTSRIETYILDFNKKDNSNYQKIAEKAALIILNFFKIFNKYFQILNINYTDYK